MKIKNILSVIALSGLMVFTTAIFAKQLTIGFSQIGASNEWRNAETDSVKAEAKRLGINLKFASAEDKQENQIKALRSFIAQGVDGILLAPIVETGWGRVLKEAKRAKIPVVLLDRGIKVSDPSLYVTLVASDFVFEGRLAASWLAQEMHGAANIVELQGGPGAAPAIDRKKGFEEIIALFPKMKILKSQTGEWTRTKGKEVMEAFLKAEGKKINAVYAHNDGMALGAIQAIKEFGLKPGKDIIIVSIDAIKPAFEAMVKGEMNATIDCNPLLGPLGFAALQKAINGEPVPKWIIQEDKVNVMANAARDLPSRKF